MKKSKRFQLNKEDIKKWATNALVFAGPALLVLLASAINEVPQDWKYGALVLYVLNLLVDLLKKFLAGKK